VWWLSAVDGRVQSAGVSAASQEHRTPTRAAQDCRGFAPADTRLPRLSAGLPPVTDLHTALNSFHLTTPYPFNGLFPSTDLHTGLIFFHLTTPYLFNGLFPFTDLHTGLNSFHLTTPYLFNGLFPFTDLHTGLNSLHLTTPYLFNGLVALFVAHQIGQIDCSKKVLTARKFLTVMLCD